MSIETELREIAARHGGLHPPTIVEWAAKHPKSALHKRFTWDDGKAAHEHRLWQARHMIATIFVVVQDDMPETRLFVSLQSDRGEIGYRDIFHVLSDADMTLELLGRALRDVQRWWEEYCAIAELAGVGEEIDRVRRLFAAKRKAATKDKPDSSQPSIGG